MCLPAPARLAGWDATARRVTLRTAAPPRSAGPPGVTLWGQVAALTAWLDAANGRGAHEVTMRVLKLAEETGEAVTAYIGMTGQNPRKGTCATRADVTGELCDVVITALVAMTSLTGTTADAEACLRDYLTARAARLAGSIREHERNAGPGEGEWACQDCGAAWFGAPPGSGRCPGCVPATPDRRRGDAA